MFLSTQAYLGKVGLRSLRTFNRSSSQQNRLLSLQGGATKPLYGTSPTVQEAGFIESSLPDIKFAASTTADFQGDILIIPFYKPDEKDDDKLTSLLIESIPSVVPDNIKSIVSDMISDGTFKGDVGSKMINRVSSQGIKYIALMGIGGDPKSKKDTTEKKIADMEIKSSNRLGKTISSLAKETKAKSIGVITPTIGKCSVMVV